MTTAHLGNWEMLVFSFAAIHEPMSYLARPLDNPMIEEMTYRIRTRFGNRPINKNNSARPALLDIAERRNTRSSCRCQLDRKGRRIRTVLRRRGVHNKRAGDPGITVRCALFPLACVWAEQIGKYRYIFGNAVEPCEAAIAKRIFARQRLCTRPRSRN